MERKFFKDEEGAAAVEYAILVALIAGVIILAVTTMGREIRDTFQQVANALKAI